MSMGFPRLAGSSAVTVPYPAAPAPQRLPDELGFLPNGLVAAYSANVRRPHRLGLVLISSVPVQAIWGMYSVPGQG